MSFNTISPQRLHDIVQSGQNVELIDVRTPAEFREVHVGFARNVPLDQLDTAQIATGRDDVGQPLYVICRSGGRGKQACEKFLATGYSNVVNVEGGTQAWDQAGLPVVRGQKTISLERQVRIVVGLLVLIGTLLGYFAHPYWNGLSAFLAAGLVFSGITGICGTRPLLARMPWNQVVKTPPRNSTSTSESCPPTPKASCCN